jgi:hypothetical protein
MILGSSLDPASFSSYYYLGDLLLIMLLIKSTEEDYAIISLLEYADP